MKTILTQKFFCYLVKPVIILPLLLATNYSSFSQGKRIYIGNGSGDIRYSNVQTQLNLKDGDTIFIKSGTYASLFLQNIKASEGSKIYILNDGLVKVDHGGKLNGPCMEFRDWYNVEFKGNYIPSIAHGFETSNAGYRALEMGGQLRNITISHLKLINIGDYGIHIRNDNLLYNGTDNPSSLFYNLKLLHLYAYNVTGTILQLGDFTELGAGFTNIFKKFEVAYCHLEKSNSGHAIKLSKVVEANVHHNKIINTGLTSIEHTGVIFMKGNGDVHHNYLNGNWGNGIRGQGFGLKEIGEMRVYNNIVLNNRKYSAVEVHTTSGDMAGTLYAKQCNYRIYNNTAGNLAAKDFQAAIVDTYNTLDGVLEIKNNIGFNINYDSPRDNKNNLVYFPLAGKLPDTLGNRYSNNPTELGLTNLDSCFLASGSLAIDQGASVTGFVTDDHSGVPRPQNGKYDIGAREFVSGAPILAPVANAGNDKTIELPANNTVLDGSASYNPVGGVLTYMWTKVSGPSSFSISNETTVSPTVSNLTEGTYEIKLVVTNTQGKTAEDKVLVIVKPERSNIPVANAGTDKLIELPTNSTMLDGSASYNPGGGALTYMWTKVSGPTSFAISNTTNATPTISNLTQGVYEIKLVVTNAQGKTAQDLVMVTVNPETIVKPVANAGTDKNITLPANSTSLDGTASYNPGGGTLTYSWSKVSGPASFAIENPSGSSTIISSLTEGSYEMKLTVTNSQGATNEDIVMIVVTPASPLPTPIANAGADTTVSFPGGSATLSGKASYAQGGAILTSYQWRQVAGPTRSSILSINTSETAVSNLEPGEYIYELRVTDNNGKSAIARKKVTVKNDFYFNKLIRLFPIPCSNFLNVRLITNETGPLVARVTGMNGIVYFTQPVEKNQQLINFTLSTKNIPSGYYVLEITQKNKIAFQANFIRQ
jgi:hypothetical protein